MFSLIQPSFSTSQARRRNRARRFHVEDLEGRTLLTLSALPLGATMTSAPVVMNGKLLFTAQDIPHGKQVWESDGTAAGTFQVSDGNDAYGGLSPTALTVVGNTLYF